MFIRLGIFGQKIGSSQEDPGIPMATVAGLIPVRNPLDIVGRGPFPSWEGDRSPEGHLFSLEEKVSRTMGTCRSRVIL